MTIVKINTGEKTETFNCGEVIPTHIRRCVIKCIYRLYNENKPKQEYISKALKKIKNNEVEKYFYNGYIIITVTTDGVESFYVYLG